MSFVKHMQGIARGAVEGAGIKIVIGEVTSISPLEVTLEQRLKLPQEVLIFPAHLQEQVLKVKDFKTTASSGGDICSGSSLSEVIRTCIIRPKLKVGDRLILSVVGQEYLIMDKEGDPDATITFTAE